MPRLGTKAAPGFEKAVQMSLAAHREGKKARRPISTGRSLLTGHWHAVAREDRARGYEEQGVWQSIPGSTHELRGIRDGVDIHMSNVRHRAACKTRVMGLAE